MTSATKCLLFIVLVVLTIIFPPLIFLDFLLLPLLLASDALKGIWKFLKEHENDLNSNPEKNKQPEKISCTTEQSQQEESITHSESETNNQEVITHELQDDSAKSSIGSSTENGLQALENIQSADESEETNKESIKKFIKWGLIIAAVGYVLANMNTDQYEDKRVDPLVELAQTTPAEISPTGELSKILSFGGDYTDIQKKATLNSLAGKTVVWRLPVEDITREQNLYIITTKQSSTFWGSTRYVPTRISLSSQNSEDFEKLTTLKNGDFIEIKGVITGKLYFLNLEIKPAILWNDRKQKEYFSPQTPSSESVYVDENAELRMNQNASNDQILNSLLNLIERDRLVVDKLKDVSVKIFFAKFTNSLQEYLADTDSLQRDLCYEVSGNLCRDIVPSDIAYLYQQALISYQLASDLINNQSPIIGHIVKSSAESQMLSRLSESISTDASKALEVNSKLFLSARNDYLKLINSLCKSKGISSDTYLNQALFNWYSIRETLLSGLLSLGMLDKNIKRNSVDSNKIIKEALK